MPYDRRTARVLLTMMGLLGVAAMVGCMRPSNLRSSAGTLPELSPAGELHPVSGEATPGSNSPTTAGASTSWAPNPGTPSSRPPVDPGTPPAPASTSASQEGSAAIPAPPAISDPANTPAPLGQPSASPAPAGEPPASPTPSPTPLLDAEIRRAQAVNRQHIESLRAAETPTPSTSPVATPPAQPETTPSPAAAAEPKPDDSALDVLAPLPLLAASPRIPKEPEAGGSTGGIAIPTLIPIDPTAAETGPAARVTAPPSPAADVPPRRDAAIADVREAKPRPEEPTPTRSEAADADNPPIAARRTAETPATSGGTPAQSRQEGPPALEIAALRLCARVKSFGSFEPMNPDALKPGRRVLVYCEMEGLEYQPSGDAFVSRLAAHLELRTGSDGRVAWEQALGIAEETCSRRRHDYFVSYNIEWPASLEPGDYRLRLIQTDLIGNRATSSEIPVTIVR